MSPEQLKGQPLDERSDLFAIGAVLYEMLSGKEAFPGESAAEVIASVVSAGPTPRVEPPAAERAQRDPGPRARARRVATLRVGGRLPGGSARGRLRRLRRGPAGHARGRRLRELLQGSGRRLDRQRHRREPRRGPAARSGVDRRGARANAADAREPGRGRKGDRGDLPRATAGLPVVADRRLPAGRSAAARDLAADRRRDGGSGRGGEARRNARRDLQDARRALRRGHAQAAPGRRRSDTSSASADRRLRAPRPRPAVLSPAREGIARPGPATLRTGDRRGAPVCAGARRTRGRARDAVHFHDRSRRARDLRRLRAPGDRAATPSSPSPASGWATCSFARASRTRRRRR